MVRFGRLELKHPVVVASGPLTDSFSKVKAAQDANAGAVSLKLTFVRVPFQSLMRSYSVPGQVIISPTNKRLDLDHGVELARRCKAELSIPIMANFSAVGTAEDDWKRLTEAFVRAGVDMLEPNYCCPNLDTSKMAQRGRHDHGGASIGENPDTVERLTAIMRAMTDIPIVPKVITADRHLLQESARAMEAAGADGIHYVGVPISGLPPVQEDGTPMMPLLHGTPPGSANGSICKFATFLGIAQIASVTKLPIMASGGLDTWKDCVDAVAWGAMSPSICSALMWWGWDVIRQVNEGVDDFLARNHYTSLDQFRGIALKHLTTPDKAVLEHGSSWVDPDRCIGCGRCAKPGHCEAITMAQNKAHVDPDACEGCGVCWSLCPTGAISYLGEAEVAANRAQAGRQEVRP